MFQSNAFYNNAFYVETEDITVVLSPSSVIISSQSAIIVIFVLLFPIGDTSLGEWTNELFGTTNIYTSIDEEVLNLSDYIQSPNLPLANTYKFKLENGTDPNVNTDHTVFYNYSKPSGVGDISIKIRLIEGTTTVAEWEDIAYETVSYTEHTLTELQASNITDYTNLFVELEAV